MKRSVSVSSKSNLNLTTLTNASDTRSSGDAGSIRGSVVGEARSETWKRRQSSITFSKLASSLNPDVFNEPRLNRVSTVKSSVSSYDGFGDAVSRSSQAGSVGHDNAFESLGSGMDRTGRHRWLRVPNFFDGVNERIWWKLVFQDEELEELYQNSQQASAKTLLRMACCYLTLASLSHVLFLGLASASTSTVIGPSCYTLLVLATLALTYSPRFTGAWEKHLCRALAVSLVAAALLTLLYPLEVLSPVARFSIATVVLTVLYLFLPLDLPMAASLGWLFTLLHEIVEQALLSERVALRTAVMKLLLHLCLHFMLASISLMSEVFRRNTFWRIGRSLLYQDQLDLELALKEKMIHSVMPEIIAGELLEIDDNAYQSIFKHDSSRFRPLMLHRMDSVTILFADIVGFTKMSSSKTASALVALLNNLFHRFDKLAEQHGCEKISTLGDCYYCVAGCPTPCLDHADRCVQMGLSMCQAITVFCAETGEDVNMRVGIHTGTVLCGIVGVHRFKFDVFSNDVQLANQMESGGVPGLVHISSATLDALVDTAAYDIRPGAGAERNEHLRDVSTYLIGFPDKQPASGADEQDCTKRCISEPALDGTGSGRRRRVPSSLRHQPPQVKATAIHRRWIASPSSGLSPVKDAMARTTVNSRSLLRVPSLTDVVDSSVAAMTGLDAEDAAGVAAAPPGPTIGGMLKERDEREAPRVKVRLSELAVSDLLRITVSPVNTERNRLEAARKARLEEQRMVIKVLNNTWDRLIELKKISSKDLSMLSLVFIDRDLEALHRLQFNTPSGVTIHTTFDSPIFSYFLQVVITFVVFLLLSLIFFVMFRPALSATWMAVFACSLAFHALIVFSVGSVCYVRLPRLARVLRPVVCNWWMAHGIVIVLLGIPAVLVATNWPCAVTAALRGGGDGLHFSFFFLQVSLTMCLLFTQLHRLVKLVVGCGVCALLIAMVRMPCRQWTCDGVEVAAAAAAATLADNATANATAVCDALITSNVHNETFLIFSVYLILIVILNRQYEAASRLNFKSQLLAQVSFEEIQQLKEQADSLLNNLLPEHVCQHLKVSSTYSENHDMVGVIFASIVNFSEFYSETFEGGIGCIRVLNELISDFDDLLCKPQFASVEKIKTIGATYMAASGLNSAQWNSTTFHMDRNQHLKALLEFALHMQKTVQEFNENMVGYEFVLRIGFNCGPVTAGVVGSTKLLYDIWGNTVNVASRMDSTGVPGRIQVPEECVERLQNSVSFTQRPDTVFVKGKGDMVTHLVESVIWPRHYRTQDTQLPVNVPQHLGINPAVIVSSSTSAGEEKRNKLMLYHRDSLSGVFDDHLSVMTFHMSTTSTLSRFSLFSDGGGGGALRQSVSLHSSHVIDPDLATHAYTPKKRYGSLSVNRSPPGPSGVGAKPGVRSVLEEVTNGVSRLQQQQHHHWPVSKTFSLPTSASHRIAQRLSPPSGARQ